MRIAILCFSLTGQNTGERLFKGLRARGHEAELFSKSKYLPDSIGESSREWTKARFDREKGAEALIFIGAVGIAVRSIAPFVSSKKTDPAVLAVDECGKYIISLLSGHLGGANELAVQAAEILGALPVITTATDLHERFAVDVFAQKNDCGLFPMEAAKAVSAAVLAGETVGFYSEFPVEGALPQGLIFCEKEEKPDMEVGIAVTVRQDCKPFPVTLQVIPRIAVLGLGCRKGREMEKIQTAAEECLFQAGIFREALMGLSSIDLKKEEPGILGLSESLKLPFFTFSAEELLKAEGTFTDSAFVKTVTGVENVCERSAVLASGQGTLLQKKISKDGVTAALAVRDWRIRFE